jgi:multidrug efflux system membrane fusion protein
VEFSVPQQELGEIRRRMAEGRLGVTAHVGDDGGSPVPGELTFVNNTVDAATGTVLLKALMPNADEALWPGQFVNVVLRLTVLPGAVIVPSSAIQAGQDGTYVFVVRGDGTVESRPVALGHPVGQEVVVERGIAPGDRVVTEGQLRLGPGVRVEVKDAAG